MDELLLLDTEELNGVPHDRDETPAAWGPFDLVPLGLNCGK
jgi:hypothetical protein